MTDMKQAAMAVWAAFGSRDADAVRALLTEDACWLAPRGNATQLALGMAPDELETREGIVNFLVNRFPDAFPDGATFDFTNVIADGSTVVFEERMRGRTSTGRDYDNLYCWVFEMEGARVCRIREYMDTLAGYRMFFGDDAIPAR